MDVFSSAELVAVVRALRTPRSFLLDRFFPLVQTSDSEEIVFDIEGDKRRATPFVSPLVAGKVVESQGFDAKTFKPAYAKDKRRFLPNGPLRRTIGEQIGGSLTPMERRNARLGMEIADQLKMLTIREEIMASEALRLAQTTVVGDGYPTTVVNYGRDAALVVALGGASLWSAIGTATPVDDIDTWADLIQEKSGSVPTDVVMDPVAWRWARQNAALKELLDTRRGSTSQAEIGPIGGRIARFVGTLGDFNIWVYQQTYVDELGATQKMLPDGTVLMGSADVEGTRAYGVVQDEEAGYNAQRFHIKSWLEKDPAVRWLLLQSAPLVIPYRPNASLAATVI